MSGLSTSDSMVGVAKRVAPAPAPRVRTSRGSDILLPEHVVVPLRLDPCDSGALAQSVLFLPSPLLAREYDLVPSDLQFGPECLWKSRPDSQLLVPVADSREQELTDLWGVGTLVLPTEIEPALPPEAMTTVAWRALAHFPRLQSLSFTALFSLCLQVTNGQLERNRLVIEAMKLPPQVKARLYGRSRSHSRCL